MLFAAISLSGTQGNLDIAVVNADGTGLKTVIGDQGKLAPGLAVLVARWPAVRIYLDP